ncbi:ankyrin repeat domain-containing protein 22 [Synchiropus splendidus]|uniref:ankyrin repeat domain-containing protein 22 n=1 Tax=Synchiropus splendidus TaxID=270530 RepID=UPI00237E3169|nr:ankyrin repeat domain-containing protein 22 [Synchiropus splendidus]
MGVVYSEPVCQLASRGDIRQLFQVLKKDPDSINRQDPPTGDTPLIAACRRGNLKVVQYLLDNGADATLANKKQRTCLHYVSRRTFSLLDHLMIIILMPILLLGYFIMLQTQKKNISLMEEVLKTDVDINAVDYKGNTALHYVCARKNQRLVPLLLQLEPDDSIVNHEGETPLDIATRLRFHKIVRLLREGA